MMALPGPAALGLTGAAVVVLVVAAQRALREFATANAVQQRALLWAFLVLCLLRAFNTHAVQGVLLSFLGAAVVLLMFGAGRALLLLALVSAVAALTGNAWHGWAADFLLNGVVPALVARACLWGARRWLPPNVFIFTLVNGFLGGALSMAVAALLKALLTAWLGDGWPEAYFIATIPMMFGEGFITGGAMALLVAYRPEWVSTFDDARYLAPHD